MMERFLRAFRLSRDLGDIEAMSDADLADLGLTRAQAVALNALPDDVPARVLAMGRVFGLDDAALLADPERWHQMLDRCNRCADLPACHRFMALEEPGAAGDVDFCANAENLAEMALST
jgi:hypothetical protein